MTMNDNFWNELRATQQLQDGLAAARHGAYVKPPAGTDPLLARIGHVCEEVQREHAQRHLAKSLVNPSLSRSPEINVRKAALAQELDGLLQELAAPASLVAEALKVYSPQATLDGHSATRGFLDTPTLVSPAAEVRTLQQAVDNRRRPELNVPEGSPVAAHLQAWAELHDHLQGLYGGMDRLSASQAFVLRQENADTVDALLGDDPIDDVWDGEMLSQVLTLHDLRSGEVQILELSDLQVEGQNWTVRFAATTQSLPLLGKGEVLRLVTTDGAQANDISHQDLEFRDGMLVVLGVAPGDLDLLRRLSVRDVQQLALLHYGYSL